MSLADDCLKPRVLEVLSKTTYFVLAGLSYFVCFKPDDMYYGAAITVDVESLTR